MEKCTPAIASSALNLIAFSGLKNGIQIFSADYGLVDWQCSFHVCYHEILPANNHFPI